MLDWLERKYLQQLSPRLRNLTITSGGLMRFSCPICGDSETNPRKARGYIYSRPRSKRRGFYCHNCNSSMSAEKFIQYMDDRLYNEMMLERLKEKQEEKKAEAVAAPVTRPPMREKIKFDNSMFDKFIPIEELNDDHPAKVYIHKRMIPQDQLKNIFYHEKFYHYVNEIMPGKFSAESLAKDEPRIIIPLIDINQHIFGVNSRALNPDNPIRYITIIFDPDMPKIWGMHQFNPDAHGYLMEGPFDSMFVPNTLACAGGDLYSVALKLDFDKDKITLVFDNEPRGVDTTKRMNKAIENGYKVAIWPSDIKEKDINDMVLSGMTADKIKHIIDENTYQGIEAQLKFNAWRRI